MFEVKQVVNSKELIGQDTTQIATDLKNNTMLQRIRDNLKLIQIMTDNKTNFLLLGVENQTGLHHARLFKILYSRQHFLGRSLKHNKIFYLSLFGIITKSNNNDKRIIAQSVMILFLLLYISA